MSMILYNIRHRGPYEYDKFVLNIMQTYNEVKRLLDSFNINSSSKLMEKKKAIDTYMDEMSDVDGVLEELLLVRHKLK